MRSLFQHVFGRRPPPTTPTAASETPSEAQLQQEAQEVASGASEAAAWDEAAAKTAPVRPVPWQRGGLTVSPDLANLARCARLREQTGQRLPGCRNPDDVLRRAQGINAPAEKEYFDRPLPPCPFPSLVLDLNDAIDQYLQDREAARALAAQEARPRLPLLLQQPPPPSMARPDRRMWRPVAEAVAAVRERLLTEALSKKEQARERERFIDSQGPEALLRLLEPPMVDAAAVRAMPKEGVATVADAYNDALSLVRDLVYFVPDLAPRLASPARVIFLFSLLQHQALFDHACGLIEDFLVDSAFTPFLGDVPHLNELVEGLSIRQLAHFCRVLALLVFEPEDRFLMESNAVLHSRDILRFRRDRLERPNPNCERNQALLLNLPCVLRRLVQLLRLLNCAPSIHALAAARHGHGGNNDQQQPPQPQRPGQQRQQLFVLLGEMLEQRDWPRVEALVVATAAAAAAAKRKPAGQRPAAAAAAAAAAPRRRRPPLGPSELLSLMQPILLARVRQRFAPPEEMEVRRVLQLVHHMAVEEEEGEEEGEGGDGGESGEQGEEVGAGGGGGGGVFGGFFRRAAGAAASATTANSSEAAGTAAAPSLAALGLTLGEARAELELYGISLMSFQTEVLFVLCSLLGGRRKLSFQDAAVGEMGLLEVLTDMFPRLSWGKRARHLHHHAAGAGAGAFGGPEGQPIMVNLITGQVVGLEGFAGLAPEALGGVVDEYFSEEEEIYMDDDDDDDDDDDEDNAENSGLEAQQQGVESEEDDEEDDGQPTQLHGPNCNCEPNSALRIQYLRLLHNALDRDDAGAFPRLKSHALGAEEREALLRGDADGAVAAVARAAAAGGKGGGGKRERGLVARILEVVGKEPKDSAERFWLCSALEAFLRGAGPSVQRHVVAAHPGLVDALLGQLFSEAGRQATPGFKQSAFDLLGELARANPAVLARVEAALPDAEAFGRLEAAIMDNLVDSNVFLRSVLLALYAAEEGEGGGGEEGEEEGEGGLAAGVGRLAVGGAAADKYGEEERGGRDAGPGLSYLRHTWARPTMARVSALLADGDEDDPLAQRCEEEAAWQRRERRRQAPRPGTAAARALLPRFHAFMQRNWGAILQRMMAAVDVRRVSHESLCVLNSALLMLVLSRRQGRLPAVVADLRARQRAEFEARGEKPKGRFSWSPAPEPPPPPASDGADEAEDGGEEAITHADFLGNFRALLFFWREYYGSRGRDRLSLEFSSRIPFAEWAAVLAALCADDADATSLVPAPLKLPLSPYALPPRYPVMRCARS